MSDPNDPRQPDAGAAGDSSDFPGLAEDGAFEVPVDMDDGVEAVEAVEEIDDIETVDDEPEAPPRIPSPAPSVRPPVPSVRPPVPSAPVRPPIPGGARPPVPTPPALSRPGALRPPASPPATPASVGARIGAPRGTPSSSGVPAAMPAGALPIPAGGGVDAPQDSTVSHVSPDFGVSNDPLSAEEAAAEVAAAAAAARPVAEAARAAALEMARETSDSVTLEEDRGERALLLYEAAEVDERTKADELTAAKGYLASFNARSQFRPPLFGLIRLYGRRRSVANLGKLFEALVKASHKVADKADALTQRAELLEDRFNDSAGARTSLEDALATDPTARAAWMAAERLAVKEGDGELLHRALAQLAELSQDPLRKARLWTELATDYAASEDPETLEHAAALLYRAAELPQGRWRAYVELERFAERTGRAQDLVASLEGRAALAEKFAGSGEFEGGSGVYAVTRLRGQDEAATTAADLYARAARARLGALGDAEGALATMDRALALRPDDSRFRMHAMHLADQAGESARAAEHASALLERGFGDASVRGGLYFRIAEAAAAAGDMAASGEALRKAVEVNAGSAAAFGSVIDQLVAAGDGASAAAEFDKLAAAEDNKKRRAALYRTAAMYSLALNSELDAATRRFRFAAEEDPQDAVSRRALVVLQARTAKGDDAKPLVATIDELLALVKDDDERVALLLKKLHIERRELKNQTAAAATAEALGRAAGEEGGWALETALRLRAAAGEHTPAAKLAEELAQKSQGELRAQYTATAARLHWAAGDEARARTLATNLHRDEPGDPYLGAVAFRLSLAANEPAAALDALVRRADAAADEPAARWLLVGAVLLAAAGAPEQARKALERAGERTPGSPAVRAALLAVSRWSSDVTLRARLADAALEDPNGGDEEVALGVELTLARVFLEHDAPAGFEALDRVAARSQGNSLGVELLHAVVMGSRHGPDAPETQSALQGVLGALPAADTLRHAIELEMARALSSSQDTREQAREVRDLLDEELGHSVAPRLLALLDAIQRGDRREVPTALRRVADVSDEGTASALRAAALASLRAQAREREARVMALEYPELPASTLTLAETTASLEDAGARASGHAGRAQLAIKEHKPAVLRRAAVWASLAGRHDEAIAAADQVLRGEPADLTCWDVVRVAGRRAENWQRVVDACSALAGRIKDKPRAAALWEEAGVVYLEHLNNAQKGEPALRKALDNDPTRLVAYAVLRRVLEARKDFAGLEALVTTRLQATEEGPERAELFWEQARLRRALGRREDAIASAQEVIERNPEHVAALALMVEVHATSGRLAQAAEALVALAGAGETPPAQRKVARFGAIDIFDVRLNEANPALDQLEALVGEGDADDKAVERAVGIATRAELWPRALRFAKLAAERAQGAENRSRSRLRVVEIQRDKLDLRDDALRTAQMAHDVLPTSLDALRAVHGLADGDERARRAKRTVDALRESMRAEGPGPERMLSVVQAAQLGADMVLARAAQRAAGALGGRTAVTSVGLPAPRVSLRDPAVLLRYRDPEDAGVGAALLDAVLPDMAELAGVSTDAFAVGRAERLKGAHPVRDALTPYAAVVGVKEFDLYVGGNDENRVAVIPGNPFVFVLGRKIAPPFDDPTRFRLVRALLLVARGQAALQALDATGAAEVVLASLAAAELPLTGGTAAFEHRLRPVAKALPRRVRKAIAESGKPIASAADPLGEMTRAARAALSTARRGALAVSGAVSTALADLEAADRNEAARRDLMLFAVSDALVGVAREQGVDRD